MTAPHLHWSCLDPTCDAHGLTTGTAAGADPSPAVRVEHLGIMRADCICPSDHLFVVRWNEVA